MTRTLVASAALLVVLSLWALAVSGGAAYDTCVQTQSADTCADAMW